MKFEFYTFCVMLKIVKVVLNNDIPWYYHFDKSTPNLARDPSVKIEVASCARMGLFTFRYCICRDIFIEQRIMIHIVIYLFSRCYSHFALLPMSLCERLWVRVDMHFYLTILRTWIRSRPIFREQMPAVDRTGGLSLVSTRSSILVTHD